MRLANYRFWVGLLGIMLYVVPLYWAGIAQGLMWKQFGEDGLLKYGNFLKTVEEVLPMYRMRAVGGSLYLVGVVLMVVNLYRTAKAGVFEPETTARAPALEPDTALTGHTTVNHRWLEGRPMLFAAGSLVAILVGGLVEIVPMYLIRTNVPTISSVKPYTPLEVLGRDLYVREGCMGCHSQLVRPFRSETERYGEYSKAGEFIYDHPFL